MTTTLTNETITELMHDVWTAMLSGDGELSLGCTAEGDVAATVAITGVWTGTVCLGSTWSAARQAAAVMFDAEVADLPDEDVDDAIGELINVIGGGIKSILPGPTELSLPTVHRPGPYQPDGHLFLEFKVDFTWLDEPVVVSVWTDDVNPMEPGRP